MLFSIEIRKTKACLLRGGHQVAHVCQVTQSTTHVHQFFFVNKRTFATPNPQKNLTLPRLQPQPRRDDSIQLSISVISRPGITSQGCPPRQLAERTRMQHSAACNSFLPPPFLRFQLDPEPAPICKFVHCQRALICCRSQPQPTSDGSNQVI